MTDEQLQKAQRLKSKIDSISHEIYIWEKAFKIQAIDLFYKEDDRYISSTLSCLINFEELKEFALRDLKRRREELEKEYAEL